MERTKLTEVQEGPMQTDGTRRRQGSNAHLAMNVQTPQSVTTGG